MDVPVLQITDEVDAAVKGSVEGGGGGGGAEAKVAAVGVQLRSRCSSLARQGVEARRLWRLGGGEAAFRAGVGAHHTGDEPM